MERKKYRKLVRRIMSGRQDLDLLEKILKADPPTSVQIDRIVEAIQHGAIGAYMNAFVDTSVSEDDYKEHIRKIEKRFNITESDVRKVKDAVYAILKENDACSEYSWEAFLGNVYNVYGDLKKGKTPEGQEIREPINEHEWVELIANDYLCNLNAFEREFFAGKVNIQIV